MKTTFGKILIGLGGSLLVFFLGYAVSAERWRGTVTEQVADLRATATANAEAIRQNSKEINQTALDVATLTGNVSTLMKIIEQERAKSKSKGSE